MKKIFFACIICVIIISCSVQKAAVQPVHAYEMVPDAKAKVLKGLLKRSDIESDTSFKWFQENYGLGMADASAVAAFQKNGSKFQMVVFFGTWCDDSQNLVPTFYRLVDKSNFPDSSITLIGVDRSKQTLDNLTKVFNVTRVPTFIVMKDGKEVGRVVEYGKDGVMDKELGEIVAGL
jgi:thiol-disulfide isomerase/thioredoxin